ncbi:MAG TPA: glycine--tRNA ligase subunit beta [Stellaceae bacterium]|nr:glycine--tRNA ligase subunit beta [Stellaceae bacterium]
MAGSSPAKGPIKIAEACTVTSELLLELLSEEIPARMQRRAIEELVGLVRDRLAAADIPAATIEGHVTPRRLVVIADGIPARQPDRAEERRGPRVGAPQQALDGFLRAAGLHSIDQGERRATDRGEFYFAVLKRAGRATAEVLPELLHAAMTALSWPKSMRYPASGLRWVRPLNSVVCLFDGAVLALPLGAVPVSRTTRGHRFLAPEPIEVADAGDYRARLAKAHVVLDRAARRAVIERDLARLAAAEGLTVKPDESLLEEVTGLVEYPVVLIGSIDADFVRPLPDGLPPEVLATAMRTHQKYFSCLNAETAPAPRFLFVANNVTPDGGKTIAAGNERVLRARLSDARFFWDQDRKIRLEDRVDALRQRVYHEKLGSVYDKVERMEKLAGYLAEQLAPQRVAPAQAVDDFRDRCIRAARLAKADLSTGMVGEFPELQGVMGRYDALNDGEDARVADAIADHYKPLGPNDTCPSAPESMAVTLADKIDALVAFFSAGEKPTGSGDPFALRRAAQGVIRVILENRLRLSLMDAFVFGTIGLGLERPTAQAVCGELLAFVADRLKVHLREQGVRHDLIAAAFEQVGATGRESDLVRLLSKVAALKNFLATDDGGNLLTAYRRAANIVSIEERRDNVHYGQEFAPDLLRDAEEAALAGRLMEVGDGVGAALADEKFDVSLAVLARLRKPVDEFFEKVTVNTEEKELRVNRLRLLTRIRNTMNQIADFSQIEG